VIRPLIHSFIYSIIDIDRYRQRQY